MTEIGTQFSDLAISLLHERELQPGETCPLCDYRKPFPKQPSSPVTKTTSYRIPVDEVEAHKDVLTTAAKFLGTHGRPHWQFQTHTIALALVLQDESLKGYAEKRPS